MPLVQWIMQNLSVAPGYGVSGGGTAEVKQTSFVFASGSVLTNGNSFYNTIGEFAAVGGVSSGGESIISETPAFRKKLRYLPGDVVYDKCNKSWVVVSFEFNDSGQNLNLANNVRQKTLSEREIFNSPVYVYKKEIFNEYSNPSILFSCKRITPNNIENKLEEISGRISSLMNEPLANLPVYTGMKKVKK